MSREVKQNGDQVIMKKNYPLNHVTPFYDFKEMMAIAVREAADSVALRYKSRRGITDITYKELNARTDQLGTALASLGFADKHIAIFSENSYKWIITYLTVLKSSGVFVPVDKELPDEEAVNIINSSDAEVLFVSKLKRPFIARNRDKLKNIKLFIDLDDHKNSEDFHSYYRLLELGRGRLAAGDTSYLEMSNRRDDIKMIVYTSGTTGMAKGVMLTERNLVSGIYYGLQVSDVFTTCLSVLPYHHTYESVCGILVSLHKHATICVNESLRAVAENLKLYKPDYIMLVPVFVEFLYNMIWKKVESSGKGDQLRALIKASNALRKTGVDLRRTMFKTIHEGFGGNLIKIVCGGAPIRPELGEFFDSIGINLINGYGITECSPLVSANRDYFSDYRTVGIVLPCFDIRIEDPNENGDGEIVVKGPAVMRGYYKNPEATANVMQDGWFHTGDLGRINEKNQLLITGRKKNLIVLKNGKNIYPEEIENYLLASPVIKEVVVYSVKDGAGHETGLLAEIYPDPEETKELDAKQIYAAVNAEVKKRLEALPAYKHVSEIEIRDTEFEKTTSKKIKRDYSR